MRLNVIYCKKYFKIDDGKYKKNQNQKTKQLDEPLTKTMKITFNYTYLRYFYLP